MRIAWLAVLLSCAALVAIAAGAIGLQVPTTDLNGNPIPTFSGGVSNAILGCVVTGFPGGNVWVRPPAEPGGTVPLPLPTDLLVSSLPLPLTTTCYSVQGWGTPSYQTLYLTVAP